MTSLGPLVPGTLAATYLRARGITVPLDCGALRFHPAVCGRERGLDATLPALLAAVTDGSGSLRAVQRTWLDQSGGQKARLATPRRSLGTNSVTASGSASRAK